MQNGGPSIGAVIVRIVAFVLCVVVIVALLSMFELLSKRSGTPAIIFACINALVILSLVTMGRGMFGGVSFVPHIQVWTVTLLYSAVQFAVLLFASDIWGGLAYTLFQVILLTLWLGIVGAVVTISKRNEKREDGLL